MCVGLFFIGFNDDAPSVEYVMDGVAEFIEQQSDPVVIVSGSITVSDQDHPTRCVCVCVCGPVFHRNQ